MTSLHRTFGQLSDPRLNRKKQHLLIDIVILSVLAVLSGAESWDSIELFGKTNRVFLKQFLKLPNGIPSHNTINRVFGMINPRHFERLFIQWCDEMKGMATWRRSSPLTARASGARKIPSTASRPSTLSMPGAWRITSAWDSGKRMLKATRSRPFRNCWICSI